MKERFHDAEIEILHFPEADIITYSGNVANETEDNELPWDIIPRF